MNTRLRFGIAAGTLIVAGIAGWWSVREPDKSKPGAVVSSLATAAPSPPALAARPAPAPPKDQSAALKDLENRLLQTLDPSSEIYSGERLAELCLESHPADLPGSNPAFSYARRWARQNPAEIFAWFQRRGTFNLPAEGGVNYAFLAVVFDEWSKKDPSAAAAGALAVPGKRDRAEALVEVISELRKSDAARAAALAAEHLALLTGSASGTFRMYGQDYREIWDFLRALPPGKDRNTLLARNFDNIVEHQGAHCAQLWKEMPEELRRELVSGGFTGHYLGNAVLAKGSPATLEGLNDLRRAHIESTSDPSAARGWVSTGGREWAARDPAAAIAWAQQHLKGEQRVTGTAQIFSAAAAGNFDTAMHEWQTLPDGMLRARAAGNIAAAAPKEHKAEVDTLLQSLSPGDLILANAARKEAEREQARRDNMEQMLKNMPR